MHWKHPAVNVAQLECMRYSAGSDQSKSSYLTYLPTPFVMA
ncbi:hypothetical protein [Methanobrevibacter sp.]